MMKEKNLELYNQVRKVPNEAKEPISGGRMNGKTSIKAMWRIKTLTEQFGPCGLGWYYVPVRKWTETVGEEIAVFVDIELYVKYADGWSKPIAGTGGAMLAAKERGGVYTSDECYKKATTDAISVACKQLGIGADVYWEKDSKDRASDVPFTPDPPSRSAASAKNARSSKGAPSNGKTKGVRSNGAAKETRPAVPLLERKYARSLYRELARTGVGLRSLLKDYGKQNIQELSFAQYRDVMDKLISKPDKPLNPQYIPPDDQGDPNSPWNIGNQKKKEEGEKKEEKKIAPVQETGAILSADLMADGYTYCGSFGGN